MHLLMILKVAVRSLRRTALRSSLTALGIVIGVASVIAMVSIGSGAKAQMEKTLAKLDSNQFMVMAQMPRKHWQAGQPPPIPLGDGLTIDDYLAIKQEIQGLSASTVDTFASVGNIVVLDKSAPAAVEGVDVDGVKILLRRVIRGASFGAADVHGAASVCLITESTSKTLFGSTNAIGRIVLLSDTPFRVVGVIADRGPGKSAGGVASLDSTTLIPYTSLLRRLDRSPQIHIMLKAQSPARLAMVRRQVSDLLERRRGNRKVDFVTGGVEQVVQVYREGSRTMALLLASIGSISLVVGGIGIMNIMLVSVTERTREIGIRVALGTRARDVMRQFLVESVLLCVVGGVLGILVGTAAAHTLTYANGWPTRVTVGSMIGAFLFSGVIGVAFGYYPARKAATMDPVEALRAE